MKTRCYRSLRKSEDPHYLAIILKEDNDKAAVSRAHCSCKGLVKEEAVDTAIMFRHCYINLMIIHA